MWLPLFDILSYRLCTICRNSEKLQISPIEGKASSNIPQTNFLAHQRSYRQKEDPC
jgi:hypothetical protein